jgi:hypothetical protein
MDLEPDFLYVTVSIIVIIYIYKYFCQISP